MSQQRWPTSADKEVQFLVVSLSASPANPVVGTSFCGAQGKVHTCKKDIITGQLSPRGETILMARSLHL